jgi:hypothetical protein
MPLHLGGFEVQGRKINKHKYCLLRRASDRCLPKIAGLPDYMKSEKLPRWYANHKQSKATQAMS